MYGLAIFFFKEREEWEITERKKLPRDLPGFEPGIFAYRANALPTEPQVTVRGVKDNVRAGGLFWRNDRGAAEVVPSEQTDSEYIIWHNAGTTHVTKNTRECRNISVFGKTLGVHGCTLTHEVLQHEESQIRQERSFVFFSMCDLSVYR